ncbi:MAG: aspartate aminotransferase family protein [Bilifractor sp.]|jgi:4-aminobutyrate aminotransferase-like enzyme
MDNNVINKDEKYLIQCYTSDQIVFDHAEGMYLYDKDDKPYLDFSAQFSACTLGHRNRELIDTITEQLNKLVSVTSMYVTEERARLAEKLVEITPDGLEKVMFGCTGSDANEFALKLAKHYKGGGKIFSFRRGFHGSTAGAAAATGKSETIQLDTGISELLPRGFVHSAPPYCFRCDLGQKSETCGFQCIKYLEQLILQEGGKVAALISEPIFAAGGVIVPPKGFWKEIRKLCDKYNILLIFDEVVTGIGQTGDMFACQYEGVTPDILVTGKGLTSGYVPGSTVICRREIGESMDPLTIHGHTHSCYPLMCAAAYKNIEIIERDHLVENSRQTGTYLHEQLKKLQKKYECIVDVRGRGLLQGFELDSVNPNVSKYEFGQKLYETMLHNGLITELESRRNLSNVIIVMHPPLITSKQNADEAIMIIEKSIQQCLQG